MFCAYEILSYSYLTNRQRFICLISPLFRTINDFPLTINH